MLQPRERDEMGLRVLTSLLVVFLYAPSRVIASDDDSAFVSLGVHLTTSMIQVCKKKGDVIHCGGFMPFSGIDVSGHLWPLDWLAVGLRLAGSTDVNSSKSIGSDGETEDRYQWLWRLSVEGRLYSPLLPSGFWFGPELGTAFLEDNLDVFGADGKINSSDSVTHIAALIGAVLGWDLSIIQALLLGFHLRMLLLAFINDPKYPKPYPSSKEIDTGLWFSLGLRLTYRW